MKINWMPFLVVISLLSSCKTKSEYGATVEYVYSNQTDYNIELIARGTIRDIKSSTVSDTTFEYNIKPHADINITFDFETNEKTLVEPSGIIKQNDLLGDSIQVIFNMDRSLVFRKNVLGSEQIYEESYYTYTEVNNLSYKYTFSFTEDDYNNAVPIE